VVLAAVLKEGDNRAQGMLDQMLQVENKSRMRAAEIVGSTMQVGTCSPKRARLRLAVIPQLRTLRLGKHNCITRSFRMFDR
jgi:hypothetical protein